ncbi:MAG: hypothetical protein WCT05_02430 [Lentisphaeria bacterium]
MNPAKTLSEHRQYLYEIIKLKLFFVYRWQKEHPDEAFSNILRQRVDIIRKTDINKEGLNPVKSYFDVPEWLSLETETKALFKRFFNDPETFETRAFELFKPTLDARCERDFLDRSALRGYQCGFLRYNTSISAEFPDMLIFHIANAKTPDSFFDYPDYMRECFLKLLHVAEEVFNVPNIGTGTWLNSVPKWLVLFPKEWTENLQPPQTDVSWHFGFWGQFITARGTFNDKYGKFLRETGQMPFYPRITKCSTQAMREKLNEKHFGFLDKASRQNYSTSR